MNDVTQSAASSELIFIIVIAVVVLGGFVLLVGYGMKKLVGELPKGRIAEVEVDPGKPFELRFTPTDGVKRRLFLRYRLHSKGGGGGLDNPEQGLVCDLEVDVGENMVVSEAVGFGKDMPERADREVTVKFNVSKEHSSSDFMETGTFVLADLGVCPAGSEIVVAGNIELAEMTEASLLEVWLGK